jgi:hypothetical protein
MPFPRETLSRFWLTIQGALFSALAAGNWNSVRSMSKAAAFDSQVAKDRELSKALNTVDWVRCGQATRSLARALLPWR